MARNPRNTLVPYHMSAPFRERWDFTTLVSSMTYSVSQQGMKSGIRLPVEKHVLTENAKITSRALASLYLQEQARSCCCNSYYTSCQRLKTFFSSNKPPSPSKKRYELRSRREHIPLMIAYCGNVGSHDFLLCHPPPFSVAAKRKRQTKHMRGWRLERPLPFSYHPPPIYQHAWADKGQCSGK